MEVNLAKEASGTGPGFSQRLEKCGSIKSLQDPFDSGEYAYAQDTPVIEFKVITHLDQTLALPQMMAELYAQEDEPRPGPAEFQRTTNLLINYPQRGQIVLLIQDTIVQGYALLIPFWSNEFGGTLLFVDELFVKREARGQGIARRFFEWVQSEKPFDAVACALEVSPKNARARKLYETIGFTPRTYTMLTLDL